MNKLAKGNTLYVCYGDYAGWFFEWTKTSKRIVLGRMSIAWSDVDIEVLVDKLVNKIEKLKSETNWDEMANMGIKKVLIPETHLKALSKAYGQDSDMVRYHTNKGVIEIGKYEVS